MKKKILLLNDDGFTGFRHGYSAIGDIMKEMQENKPWAISASYAIPSSYQLQPMSTMSGSCLPPWINSNGTHVTASWVSRPSDPYTTTPFVPTPTNNMKNLYESLDHLYACRIDLEEEVVSLKEQLADVKYDSANFLVSKNLIEVDLGALKDKLRVSEMETTLLKDQVQSLAKSLNEEKNTSCNEVLQWKLKYEAMDSNHKFAVHHCDGLNKVLRIAKDEVTKLRNEKVNEEQLARQLLVKTKEIELDHIQMTKDIQTIETGNRVRQELADFLAASKTESENRANYIRTLTLERDAAIKKYADGEVTVIAMVLANKNMEAEYKKIVGESIINNVATAIERDHLRRIIGILTRGITAIIGVGVFVRKNIANQVKEDVVSYILRNKLDTGTIYDEKSTKE